MRLTKKSEKFINAYEWNRELPTKTFVQLGINKLGKLEDIEKELGVDLITLHKSFEEDIWIKFNNKIMFVPYDEKVFVFCEGNIHCYPLNEQYGYTVSIDNYGKTWALTKKELL